MTKLGSDAALANWTVSAASNGGHFVLERSTDGRQFISKDSVGATGNGVMGEPYSYTDHSPAAGVDYYRLRTVDAAGVSAYSPVDLLTFGASSGAVTLYPSPTEDILHIRAPGIAGARIIDVVAVSGEMVASYPVAVLDGASLTLSRLAAGSYFVRIRGGGQPIVLPFLKE